MPIEIPKEKPSPLNLFADTLRVIDVSAGYPVF